MPQIPCHSPPHHPKLSRRWNLPILDLRQVEDGWVTETPVGETRPRFRKRCWWGVQGAEYRCGRRRRFVCKLNHSLWIQRYVGFFFVVWFKFSIIIILVLRKQQMEFQPLSVWMRQLSVAMWGYVLCVRIDAMVSKDQREAEKFRSPVPCPPIDNSGAWGSSVTRWNLGFLRRGA